MTMLWDRGQAWCAERHLQFGVSLLEGDVKDCPPVASHAIVSLSSQDCAGWIKDLDSVSKGRTIAQGLGVQKGQGSTPHRQ